MSLNKNNVLPYSAFHCLLEVWTQQVFTPADHKEGILIPLDYDDLGYTEETITRLDFEAAHMFMLAHTEKVDLFLAIGSLEDAEAARYGVKNLNALLRAVCDPSETEVKSRLYGGVENRQFYCYYSPTTDPVTFSFKWWYEVPELRETGHTTFKV